LPRLDGQSYRRLIDLSGVDCGDPIGKTYACPKRRSASPLEVASKADLKAEKRMDKSADILSIGYEAVRLTFAWDLHALASDDVRCANSCRGFWQTLESVRYLWPSPPDRDVQSTLVEHVATHLRASLAHAAVRAADVQGRLQNPTLDPSLKQDLRAELRQAAEHLECLWRVLHERLIDSETQAFPSRLAGDALDLAKDAATRALPQECSGGAEPFAFLRLIRDRSREGDEAAGRLCRRISRRWTILRKTSRFDVRSALRLFSDDQDIPFDEAKFVLVRRATPLVARALDRPNYVRLGRRWITRSFEDGSGRRAKVWVTDRCPYVVWRWFGNTGPIRKKPLSPAYRRIPGLIGPLCRQEVTGIFACSACSGSRFARLRSRSVPFALPRHLRFPLALRRFYLGESRVWRSGPLLPIFRGP